MDTWNDQEEFETSALEARDLFEQMQRTWTWPAPRLTDAATSDQLEGANLDPTARTHPRDQYRPTVVIELPDDLGEIVLFVDTARDFARSIYDQLEETPDGARYGGAR